MLLLSAAVPALAHHSFAMFDQTQTLTLSGTVKEFQFTSPHAWIQILVAKEDGKVEEWGFELGSSAALSRGGWKKSTVAPGDKITVTFNPLKSGETAGSFKSATFADGRPVGPQRKPQ
jgi:hypothetical protein